jgi:ribosomal protein L22
MTPEIEPEDAPKRRRRLRGGKGVEAAAAAGVAPASEAPRLDESQAADEPEAMRGASAADATPVGSAGAEPEPEFAADSSGVDPQAVAPSEPLEVPAEPPVEPTPEDVEAEEAAADVMLEADDEAEGVAPSEPLEVSAEPPADPRLDEDEDEDEDEEPDGEESPGTATSRRLPLRRRRKAAEPAPPKPTPTRRRSRRDPNAPLPVVRAQAKYVRSSARKARLVCDHIRGKSVEEARAILALTPRAIARDWSKLLESAVANAEHNHELVGEDLYVKAVHADEGPTIKRFRPRAMGRATRIRKRTSHLTILLTPKE